MIKLLSIRRRKNNSDILFSRNIVHNIIICSKNRLGLKNHTIPTTKRIIICFIMWWICKISNIFNIIFNEIFFFRSLYNTLSYKAINKLWKNSHYITVHHISKIPSIVFITSLRSSMSKNFINSFLIGIRCSFCSASTTFNKSFPE